MDNNIDIKQYAQQSLSFKTEEDVRAETNMFLRLMCKTLGIELNDSGHEITSVYGGRADSMYSNVIIEYKAPNVNLHTRKGFNEVINGRDNQDHGLRHYLINFSLEKSYNSNELFLKTLKNKIGVGFNGKTFIFVRYIDSNHVANLFYKGKTKAFPNGIDKKQLVDLQTEVIDDLELGFKKLMLCLRSTARKVLSSNSILELFGPGSALCERSIPAVLKCLLDNITKNNLRVITLYKEWNRIFGDVYGDKETDFTSIRSSLLSLYKLDDKGFDIRQILFTIQTYYNIILKLLVFDLLSSLKDPTFVSSKNYRPIEIYQLFNGKMVSENYDIQNFFEVQFFEWFLFATDFDYTIIQDSLIALDNIEATASVIKPEIVEDVFREVYNGLIPKSVRHLLGEYYTPGWLVEFVLDKANYIGQPDKTLLDPACGSGSFVTHAIKRYYSNNESKMTRTQMVSNVTKQIVGYDINPIAVITAKTNYILALGDIGTIRDPINIPIYMCDSVLVPTVHAKQNSKSHTIKIKTVVGEFEVPVFNTRIESDIFMREVSRHVETYTFDEFIRYLEKNGLLNLDNVNLKVAQAFYEKVCELHLTSQDGFWGTILKNAFAPLFAHGGFDIVVGNPPWIAWKAMSDTYRAQTLDIWLSYGIFEKSAYDKITTHDDFAMAVTYVAIDHYCKEQGELVFVLPQTFLKASKGGEGFRKFCITRDDLEIPFAVTEVYDMLKINPFRGVANNRASVIKFQKNKKMVYPMDNYWECIPNGSGIISYNDPYSVALRKFDCVKLQAKPIKSENSCSPWLTLPANEMSLQDRYLGPSAYRGRKGIEPCGAKGIYLVDIQSYTDKTVTIKNLIERSRLQEAKELGVHSGEVEKDLIYPMIGGRNIDKWGINSNLFMVVPHYCTGEGIYRGIPESEMKVNYPRTFDWLKYFYKLLLETRIRSGKFYDSSQYPFYRLDNVGPYTFMPFHVVWREQNKKMVACVVSGLYSKALGNKIIVTDSKVLSCPFDNEAEAHYLCAVINSPIISKIIESYTIDTQRGVDILNNIQIPKFDKSNNIHKKLAKLSMEAHNLKGQGRDTNIIEETINIFVGKIFCN